MSFTQDYTKLPSNRHVTVLLGPGGSATGIADVATPTADELNNTGGTSGMLNASVSTSFQDYDFGIQEAETSSDPSLADESTFEDLGPAQFGGSMSFYYPRDYDDNSNNHSLVYDLTDTPWTPIDIGVRIDGNKNNVSQPIADGDFVSTFRTWTDSEANALDAEEAYRRTVGFQPLGESAFYTIVGDHTITALPPASAPWAAGKKARLRATVQDRDYTNALTFTSSDPDVVRVLPGGFYEVTGTASDTATITIEDRAAGTSTSVQVTVA